MDMGPDGSYKYTGLTHKMHRKCMICMHFLCQSSVLMRPPYDTAHCIVWWPGASFGGQAPRWYPRFTLGDLFVTTLIVKWPGASFGGQAPRWYPRFCWAVPKRKKKKNKEGPFTVDTGTRRSHDNTGLTQNMHQNRSFSMPNPV